MISLLARARLSNDRLTLTKAVGYDQVVSARRHDIRPARLWRRR